MPNQTYDRKNEKMKIVIEMKMIDGLSRRRHRKDKKKRKKKKNTRMQILHSGRTFMTKHQAQTKVLIT